jgi:hypothetical protein
MQIEARIKFCVGLVTYQQANQTSSMAWDLVCKADFNSEGKKLHAHYGTQIYTQFTTAFSRTVSSAGWTRFIHSNAGYGRF